MGEKPDRFDKYNGLGNRIGRANGLILGPRQLTRSLQCRVSGVAPFFVSFQVKSASRICPAPHPRHDDLGQYDLRR